MINTLFSAMLLLVNASAATAMPPSGTDQADIRLFIQSSELCSEWHQAETDFPESASTIKPEIQQTCTPLPARLVALRQAHHDNPAALQLLSSYDASTGETHAAWPKDVASLLQRADDCNASAGEFNGDGSQQDRDTNRQMDRLHCDRLIAQIGTLRQRYRDDARIATRLTSFDDQGLPMPPLPADVRAFTETSRHCAAAGEPVKSDCATLAKQLHELKARYPEGPDVVASNAADWLAHFDDATGWREKSSTH